MAAAAPVVLPSILGERDMIAGFDLGSGDRTAIWVSGKNPPPFMVFDGKEIRALAENLRPGAIYWLQTPDRNWFDLRAT